MEHDRCEGRGCRLAAGDEEHHGFIAEALGGFFGLRDVRIAEDFVEDGFAFGKLLCKLHVVDLFEEVLFR